MVEEHKENNDEIEDFIPETEDQEISDVELEDEEEMSAGKMKKLRDELRQCQKEKTEYLDGWQRTKADIMNIKKRQIEESIRDRERSAEDHIVKLLPLCDSFTMALRDTDGDDVDSWKKGVEQIHSQLTSLLKAYGVEEVGVEGEPFDPHIHESVSNSPVTEKEKNETVISVFQGGYKMGERLIRPAKVVVGEYTE